jgi:dCMP deaminase
MGQNGTISKTWDNYFYDLCKAVASKSPCLSRKIGAILVKDRSIVSTGYNGPPRGVPHCGHERLMRDNYLSEVLEKGASYLDFSPTDYKTKCPRRLLNIPSGEGMEWCPAQHAEENAVSNAARLGTSVLGSILYMNSFIPCQKCFGTLINAGISQIVIDDMVTYDKHTQFLINNSSINIRRFIL